MHHQCPNSACSTIVFLFITNEECMKHSLHPGSISDLFRQNCTIKHDIIEEIQSSSKRNFQKFLMQQQFSLVKPLQPRRRHQKLPKRRPALLGRYNDLPCLEPKFCNCGHPLLFAALTNWQVKLNQFRHTKEQTKLSFSSMSMLHVCNWYCALLDSIWTQFQ